MKHSTGDKPRTAKRVVPTRKKCGGAQWIDPFALLTHDIRNLLSVILGYTEILQEAAQGRKANAETAILEKLRANVMTILSLMKNYASLSQLEAGQFRLNTLTFNLNDVLLRVKQQYEDEARRRGILLKVCIRKKPLVVKGDPLALERVFSNLVNNALKFTTSGGAITITAAERGTDAVTSVLDSGIGIASADLPLLFHKYQRTIATQAYQGVGLGLFIVKSLVDLHGGRITVESSLGKGSCFTVFLPLHHSRQRPLSAKKTVAN